MHIDFSISYRWHLDKNREEKEVSDFSQDELNFSAVKKVFLQPTYLEHSGEDLDPRSAQENLLSVCSEVARCLPAWTQLHMCMSALKSAWCQDWSGSCRWQQNGHWRYPGHAGNLWQGEKRSVRQGTKGQTINPSLDGHLSYCGYLEVIHVVTKHCMIAWPILWNIHTRHATRWFGVPVWWH